MRRKRILGLAVIFGLMAPLFTAPAGAAEPARGLAWAACPEDVKVPADIVLQCATVPVPLDYRTPEGGRIDIMISRLASTKPAARRGVLMLNPGGPGGPGLSFPADLASHGMPASVLDGYDVIGMDTRGIGHSTPVSCGFTAEQEYLGNIPPYAVDEAAVAEQAKIAKGVAAQCAANDKDGRLRHISTANMARDLDRIRAALGEEKTSFLGYSYGSALGAAYASMFPERSDRVVLDSNIGDTHLDRDGLRRFGLGAEETFPDFAKWVAARHESYGLGRTAADVRRTYFELAEKLDKTAVNGLDGRLFRLATFAGLYGKTRYGQTAQWSQSVRDGDKAAAERVATEAKRLSLAATPAPADNMWSVFLAVTCNDVAWPSDVRTYQRGVAEDRERYPLFGAAGANISPCAFWPYAPAEPPVAVKDKGPENVLVVQNRRDPATPLRGGQLLDEKFGARSRLVTVDASGHGVYVLGGNACALNTTTNFLLSGKLPKRDVFCS
ncbi:alpha/beta hydrolase [Amycolatopsis roodepoortensis]|uniref:Pimeloyl-ACP methyl ester carboxylesterase n=1 Tax=Amycolatopsis roodepoortensis TaxID=700274 RepID=A0ABR9L8T1_9PSEU|nr:alpha/beta hydrolase [Amycolatopsis roodepoortensis]MBE1577103.1 pimeloyl-ACP methyl ester carboxylesterase [Amycolatopsis roodepoortensis]